MADMAFRSRSIAATIIAPRRKLPRPCGFVIAFLWLTYSALGQTPASSAQPCKSFDLTPTLQFYRTPDSAQIVALNYRNVSGSACLLRPVRVFNGTSETPIPQVISPGETVHSTIRLSSEAMSVGNPCPNAWQMLQFVAGQPNPTMSIFFPSLIPKACPSIQPSTYSAGPFVPDWQSPPARTQILPPAPVLIAPKRTYYKNEMVELRLMVSGRSVTSGTCPVLLVSLQNIWGVSTRENVNQNVISTRTGCIAWSRRSGNWWGPPNEYPIEVNPNGERGTTELGERIVTVSELAGTGPDGEQRLITSNPVTITIADAALIERRWGETENGVRADLTLDTLNYTVGEDVPLHLAFENVSADRDVYARAFEEWGDCFDRAAPGAIDFHLSVENADGSLPVFFDPLLGGGSCRTGSMPSPVAKGNLLLVESSLAHLSGLPRTPGVYKVTASWKVYTKPPSNDAVAPVPPAPVPQVPFVIVTSAPLMIRISR
jgi:hypothetical protein